MLLFPVPLVAVRVHAALALVVGGQQAGFERKRKGGVCFGAWLSLFLFSLLSLLLVAFRVPPARVLGCGHFWRRLFHASMLRVLTPDGPSLLRAAHHGPGRNGCFVVVYRVLIFRAYYHTAAVHHLNDIVTSKLKSDLRHLCFSRPQSPLPDFLTFPAGLTPPRLLPAPLRSARSLAFFFFVLVSRIRTPRRRSTCAASSRARARPPSALTPPAFE